MYAVAEKTFKIEYNRIARYEKRNHRFISTETRIHKYTHPSIVSKAEGANRSVVGDACTVPNIQHIVLHAMCGNKCEQSENTKTA